MQEKSTGTEIFLSFQEIKKMSFDDLWQKVHQPCIGLGMVSESPEASDRGKKRLPLPAPQRQRHQTLKIPS
jgi:hypothetical protein